MSEPIAENPDLDRRIAADPEDLDAYLVYADWLQGRGDPRGELITIQHALAERPTDYDLIKAESRLIHQHPGHFLPEDLLGLGNAEWAWRLGFLRHATIRGNQAALEQLLVHPSAKFLASLSCEAWVQVDALAPCLEAHAGRATLRQLSLDCPSPLTLARDFWQRCPRLDELALGHVGAPLDDLVSSSLRRLRLRSSWVPFDLEPLLDGTATPSLRELVLHSGSADQLETLIGSKLLAQLEVLELDSCGLRDHDAPLIMQNAARFSHLKRLSLEGNYFDNTERRLSDLGGWVHMGYQHFDATLLYEPNVE